MVLIINLKERLLFMPFCETLSLTSNIKCLSWLFDASVILSTLA